MKWSDDITTDIIMNTNLQEQAIACLLLDGGFDAKRVGNSQVITNNLD
jgi:hypothetical protein